MRAVASTLTMTAGLCLALLPGAKVAAQEGPCGPYNKLAEAIFAQFHERPVARSIAFDPKDQVEGVIVIFASPLGRTWTAIMADPKGEKACIMAHGIDWAPVTEKPPGGEAL